MLLVYPSYGRENLEDIKENLLTIAYTSVPEEVIKSLMTLIDRENDHHRNIFVIEKIESCWDDSIANALFNKLKDKKLTHESFERILITLLDHNNTKAKKFAISLVRSINQAKSNPTSTVDASKKKIEAGHFVLLKLVSSSSLKTPCSENLPY